MTSQSSATIITPLRASDIAYEKLREMILDLRLEPGELLNESSLASMLELGRMPVREAIGRLVTDHFIVVLPRRGTVVASMTMVDIADLFDAREAVECGIARVVARHITDEQIEELRALVEVADTSRGEFDAERYLLNDLRIHRLIVDLLDNSLLRTTANTLLLHNLRFWRSFFRTRTPLVSTMLSHADLLRALELRDGDAAEEATREHLEGARQLLMSLFESNDNNR
ncbi:MAG TPA: GntR family transcriptional regulator [Acidimicrobiales bacterium]|jgi:DNA-binding GntR family transcriptional regulator